jgi:hypothetical protein
MAFISDAVFLPCITFVFDEEDFIEEATNLLFQASCLQVLVVIYCTVQN